MFSAAQGLGVDNVLEIKVNLGTRMGWNHKDIGFLSKTGPDPLKNHIPSQHSMLGHHDCSRQHILGHLSLFSKKIRYDIS